MTALLFYSAHLRQQEKTTLFERTVLQVTAPFQMVVDAVWDTVSGGWNRYLWLMETERRNEQLLKENRRLHGELASLQEVRLANERLRRLLDFRDQTALPAMPAQVIAEDATSWFRTVVINKGHQAGVHDGMPVVVAEGAVGRVIRSSAHESRVLLVTDASSAIASLVQRNRTRGVCRGRGDSLTMDFALRQEDIEVGDQIVTSGTGGVFPKGLVLGTVTRVTREEYGLFQTVDVAPSVDFSRLEEVLVLLKDGR